MMQFPSIRKSRLWLHAEEHHDLCLKIRNLGELGKSIAREMAFPAGCPRGGIWSMVDGARVGMRPHYGRLVIVVRSRAAPNGAEISPARGEGLNVDAARTVMDDLGRARGEAAAENVTDQVRYRFGTRPNLFSASATRYNDEQI
jgi:hypothetical protein